MNKNWFDDVSVEELYISQLFDYYRECYLNTDWCLEFVENNSRIPASLKDNQYIGLCNRSIGQVVPKARSLEGGAIRGGLQHVGLITATGGELFRGCLVFPEICDDRIVAATGVRYGQRIRTWQDKVIRWNKPKLDDFHYQGLHLANELVHAKAYH